MNRPRGNGTISSFAFGWIATAALVFIYTFGSSFVIALLADSVSTSAGIDISSSNLFLAAIIGQTLFLLLPTLSFSRIHPLSLREVLRIRKAPLSSFLYAGTGALACLVLGSTWLMFQELYLVPESLLPLYHDLQGQSQLLQEHLAIGANLPLMLLALAAIGITPAISEEFAFRGLIQRSFEERLNPRGAIVLTGLLFGIIHLQPINLLPLIGIGIFLGLIARTSRSIWPAVFGHFLFNSVNIILFNYSGIQLPENQQNISPEDLSAILPLTIIAAIILIGVLAGIARTPREPEEPSPASSELS